MTREYNFLIGYGERLTYEVPVPTRSGDKNMPYEYSTSQERLKNDVSKISEYIQTLPDDACPQNKSVAIITMHPRFVSKSEFPIDFIKSAGFNPIGSRQKKIAPDRWGIKKHPREAQTEQIFVSGTRDRLYKLSETAQHWNKKSGAAKGLLRIESILPFTAESKIKSIPADRDEILLEVILHNANDEAIIKLFIDYVRKLEAFAMVDKRRDIEGLTFIPVKTRRVSVSNIAKYSFVRVCRGMPTLRPIYPAITRQIVDTTVDLPTEPAIVPDMKAVTFDGGIPKSAFSKLSYWVSLTEPPGIGPAVPQLEEHGLAVTSAFLFGHLVPNKPIERPICEMEHVRVVDERDNSTKDIEYIDVIERIVHHLDANKGKYEFVNISIGPDIPISDDEISYWTLAIDRRFASLNAVVTVAAGNTGELDANTELNRIQPPSDAVSVLSVGAADSMGDSWSKAKYSSEGPGRSPGIVKPDGVAFGGALSEPFHVLDNNLHIKPVMGTSLASPLTLRAATSVTAQLGAALNSLTVRALMIHFAKDGKYERRKVGWGRFELDSEKLITCEDCAPTVIYQGVLPVGTHRRIPIPLPKQTVNCNIHLTATLLISPEIDPGFLGTYTESGFMAVFRPDSRDYHIDGKGKKSTHPKTLPFFSESTMYGKGEYEIREGGLKWEPCQKGSKNFRYSTLYEPVFDVYYHTREEGLASTHAHPIPYSLIITINAPKIRNLYNQVIRTHPNILVPIRPQIRIRVSQQSR